MTVASASLAIDIGAEAMCAHSSFAALSMVVWNSFFERGRALPQDKRNFGYAQVVPQPLDPTDSSSTTKDPSHPPALTLPVKCRRQIATDSTETGPRSNRLGGC
eukprot:CAMPEP_0197621440 /NCGR_PEP_ID=MMETSP1338-20131121/2039_1 /TAXON_ID=43686 ORGANISM="Pelagodinium beii, Strain RCC1491" /NCGR_SAMPLE_ID=MMETSP1338 /ASSEMBLY_ACC=CAM_ASM_000754 /LENGTH=103 /DNA_ID=CAMNT_0043190925 /DNA_START=67 /DNA_END=378 /DNA_ORIENTATION=-